MLAPQPEASIVNDPEQQADFWRDKTEAKTQENEELTEKNSELEQAIEELEKEVERLNDEHTTCGSNNDTSNDNSDNYSSESLEVEATFYTAFCSTGCIGITATGLDVSSTIYTPDGYRVIAVDPSVIALGSIVKVTLDNGDSFEAKAADTGGLIKGNKIDVLVENTADAVKLGRQKAVVEVVE